MDYDISVVIPVYNSEKTIGQVVNKLISLYSQEYRFEIILVDDYSKDNSNKVCKNLAIKNNNIKLISLCKNYGQHSAIMAGLTFCKGEYVVLMDDDMQNPPEEVSKLIHKIEKGYDVVCGARQEYRQNAFRKFGSSLNNQMFNIMLDKDKGLIMSNFLVMRKYIVKELIKYDGPYPYIQGLILRTTRNVTHVLVEHQKREVGKSNYNLLKLLRLWTNGLTNFSIKPLRISTFLGTFFALVGFIVSLVLFIRKIVNPSIQLGWTSLMVTIVFLSGVQLISIGMLGEYIGRLFMFQNKSPQFVIKEVVNLKTDED